MLEEEVQKLNRMETELSNGVIGQKEAIQKITDAIKRSRVGISNPNKPIGSFMFLGPTGVDKTLLPENNGWTVHPLPLLTAEGNGRGGGDYHEQNPDIELVGTWARDSISKLIGSSLEYVGYEEGSNLTEAVCHRTYSVILFDEI